MLSLFFVALISFSAAESTITLCSSPMTDATSCKNRKFARVECAVYKTVKTDACIDVKGEFGAIKFDSAMFRLNTQKNQYYLLAYNAPGCTKESYTGKGLGGADEHKMFLSPFTLDGQQLYGWIVDQLTVAECNGSAAIPSPQTSTPAMKKKGGSKAWIWIALVLLLLGGGAAGGFFYHKKKSGYSPV